MAKRPTDSAPFPSKEEILNFIRESTTPVGKKEIARAFRIRGGAREDLKRVLAELREEGLIGRGRGRRLTPPDALPAVAVIEISGIDTDGELLGRPTVWHGEGPPPSIYMAPERPGIPALGPGDRVLARLRRGPDGVYEARTIRVIAGRPSRVLGVFETGPEGGMLRATDRRHKSGFLIAKEDRGAVQPGDLVEAEILPGRRQYGLRRAKVLRRLGHSDEPGAISLIAIHSHDIPVDFTDEALAEAADARPCGPEGRVDLRAVALVTIDGPDARDFDDAVFAEPDPDPENPGGWHLIVAIADVAHYVRPGRGLDRCAFERGNSVYFPDRVVPMLPEALSNDLCSLRPNEDRACLAAHIWIGQDGALRRHRFERGLMRSAARLTYGQVQEAQNGHPDAATAPLREAVIAPLYGAFTALAQARARRGTLELDMPERRVVFGEDGHIAALVPDPRFDSHRLIEEFMITANVAAAETLEARHQPCMYRVHDQPDPTKVEALREFLAGLGYRLAKGEAIRPRHFTGILSQAEAKGQAHLVSELVLRAQARAEYTPDNIGHFGLALHRYCHFTSPIRRYADLLVHRALISGLGLGKGGLTADERQRFAEIGTRISATERRAVAAERDAFDRYTVAYLEDRTGATFSGRITGVTRFGLFVALDETGADGLVPARSLADDYYDHDERRHALVGRRGGRRLTLGDEVTVRLVEADVITGGLLFEIVVHRGKEMPTAEPTSGRRSGRNAGPISGRSTDSEARRGGRSARKPAGAPRGRRKSRH